MVPDKVDGDTNNDSKIRRLCRLSTHSSCKDHQLVSTVIRVFVSKTRQRCCVLQHDVCKSDQVKI